MKTKLLFLVLALAFVLTSCKSTKQVSKTEIESSTTADIKTQTSNRINLDVAKTADNRVQTFGNTELADKGSVAETTTEETTKTNFSAPDSSGKQYPTSQTTTKKTVKRNENKNLQENKHLSTDNVRKEAERDKSDYNSDSKVADKTKSKSSDNQTDIVIEKAKTPGWVYYLSSLCLVFFLGFVFYKVTK